jgi:phage-related minor tail protein
MAGEPSPSPARETVTRQLARLESRIDETVALVASLRREQAALAAQLEQSERVRREAAQRVQALLDRIDGLG